MDVLAKKQNFYTEYYPAYAEVPDLGHLSVYICWWKKILARDRTPTRKDIAFGDLRGLHSRISLCRILEDRSAMAVRIVGEDVKNLFRNYRLKKDLYFSNALHLRDLVGVKREMQDSHLRRIADDHCLAVSRGSLILTTRRTAEISAIDFPLAPLVNETPHVLTIYDFGSDFPYRNTPHYGLNVNQDVFG